MDKQQLKGGDGNCLPWWVKSILVLGVSGVVCYRIGVTPWSGQLDFPTLLSLLLAFFSVGLAALFYFKATETSNIFYDNTYKFTQEIAELLSRIESGFGERLRHLDEAYKGMRDSFDRLPGRVEIKDAKKEMKHEEEELGKLRDEREKLIKELAARSQLNEEEQHRFVQELNAKEEALVNAQAQMHVLDARLQEMERVYQGQRHRSHTNPELAAYIREALIPEFLRIGRMPGSPMLVRRDFRMVKGSLSERTIKVLRMNGLLDEEGDLSSDGVYLVLDLLRKSGMGPPGEDSSPKDVR